MLLAPKDWIDREFGDSPRRPHPSSVRRWIDQGELPGKKIGGRYYVIHNPSPAQATTGDDVVDRILRDGTKAA
jgi:hypothetical protein